MENFMPYEGAGFILFYENIVILGRRIKKEEDLKKDPTPEVEYFGGKIDKDDLNDPYATAYNELVEEIGSPILDNNWKERTQVIHIFQPFSKKWIWCFKLRLNQTEYAKFCQANIDLQNWNINDMKDFSSFTGRKTLVRRAISSFVFVSENDFKNYISNFNKNILKSENRMNDAKNYRFSNKLKVRNIDNHNIDEYDEIGLRAFNIVIFEEHF